MFDDGTARELMRLRREFDASELAAIREFDATVGAARIQIDREHYTRQLATREVAERQWTPEQRKRAAAAWPIRIRKIDDAEARLSARTAAILRRFGYADDRLPPVRRRKWDGPSVYGFDAFRGTSPPESRALLLELRRLWSLSTRVTP